ncbi:MAG: FtsX-like permease family protein [Spirochaetia bacterium]|jgi:ABC-type lipoprotein release transport system permease subunit
MELIRYLLSSLARRPLRAGFVMAAGALSAAVLVFAFALGARSTEHIRTDTIAKWTGHLWVSQKDDFEFKEEDLARYQREAKTVRDYLSGHPNTATLVPWRMTRSEIQAGTARQYLLLTATDFQKDEPYRKSTELVAGRFPGPEDEYGLLVTTVLADKYKLKPGSSITVFIPSAFGARNAMDFVVTGIYRASAPWYDEGITIRAQDYLAMSELGDASPFYKAYVRDERGIPSMVAALAAQVPDFPVKGYRDDKFVRFLLGLGTSNVMFFGFMAMIIFLALLIGIRSVILTNIFDRREEIGSLRALGFPRGTVRMLFFGESLVSLFLGYLAGAGAVAVIAAVFEARIVRPPLLMLQYMFGMTRMGLTLNAVTLTAPLLLLFLILFATTFRTVGRETEKQAAAQMASR